MKSLVPLSMLKAMAVGAISRREKKPRHQFTKCRVCGRPSRTDRCFKCEQDIDRQIQAAF